MAPILLKPTRTDRAIADFVADHTSPGIENVFNLLTLAGDEHLIFSAMAAAAIVSTLGTNAQRKAVAHLWLATLSVTAISHALKYAVNQRRPDRTEAPLKGEGIPHSGGAYNAFPSGHAMYMGAIASALARHAPQLRLPIWLFAGAVSTSRIIVLAHWFSDVLVGLGLGALVEWVGRSVEKSNTQASRR